MKSHKNLSSASSWYYDITHIFNFPDFLISDQRAKAILASRCKALLKYGWYNLLIMSVKRIPQTMILNVAIHQSGYRRTRTSSVLHACQYKHLWGKGRRLIKFMSSLGYTAISHLKKGLSLSWFATYEFL